MASQPPSQPQPPQPQPQPAQGPAVGISNSNRNHNNRRHHHRKRPHRAQQRRGRGHYNNKKQQQQLPQNCSECNTLSPKYKCPKCRAPYCSIACCRTHKEKSCKQGEDESSKVEDDETKNVASSNSSKYLPCDQLVRDPLLLAKRQRQATQEEDDLDEGWKITTEMKQSIDNSDWLRKELQDGGLRQVIYEIDCASNNVVDAKTGTTEQEQVLQKAKERYPNFAVFLDKLLVVTGVLERQEETKQEPLEEWLQRSGHGIDNSLGPLMLKPVRKKARPCWDSESSSSSEEESTDNDSDSDDSSTTSGGSSSEGSSDTDSSIGSKAS